VRHQWMSVCVFDVCLSELVSPVEKQKRSIKTFKTF